MKYEYEREQNSREEMKVSHGQHIGNTVQSSDGTEQDEGLIRINY